MENSNAGKIILAFFMVILGVVLIGAIANGSDLVTSKTGIVNETVSIASARNNSGADFDINSSAEIIIANAPSGWKVTDCPISSFSMKAENGTILVSATDYTLTASTGTLTFMNTSEVNQEGLTNVTTADYTFCPDAYLNIAWGRSILNLIAGFVALAVLGVGLGLFYSIAKDAGIIGK